MEDSYLWPGYNEDASSHHHVLLIILMTVAKRREDLPAWSMVKLFSPFVAGAF